MEIEQEIKQYCLKNKKKQNISFWVLAKKKKIFSKRN